MQDLLTKPYLMTIIQSFNFVIIAFLLTHWISCVQQTFYLLSLNENGDAWRNLQQSSWERYIFYLYWSMVTMTSVGYGDILPSSNDQMVVAIVTMCITSIFFGHLVGGIESILAKFNAETNYFKNLLTDFRRFSRKNKFPKSLGFRINRYVGYLKDSYKRNILNQDEILNILSKPLREEIFVKTRGFCLIKSSPFNHYKFSFLRYLGNHLRVKFFAPRDRIFRQDELSEEMYFILDGHIEIFHHNTRTTYKELNKGKYFGQIGFFLGTKRSASARCLSYAQVFSLSRYTFFELLETRPKEKEITDLIRNTCQHYDLETIGVKCYLCRCIGHIARDCTKFVVILDKSVIVEKADRIKYKIGKIVSINPRKLKVNRRIREQRSMETYTIKNVSGGEKTPRELYPSNFSMISKAFRFKNQQKILQKKETKLSKINEEIEASSDDDSCIANIIDGSPNFREFNSFPSLYPEESSNKFNLSDAE